MVDACDSGALGDLGKSLFHLHPKFQNSMSENVKEGGAGGDVSASSSKGKVHGLLPCGLSSVSCLPKIVGFDRGHSFKAVSAKQCSDHKYWKGLPTVRVHGLNDEKVYLEELERTVE
ncbi:Hypothetical predicted protein, partial [Prunus dulcis]